MTEETENLVLDHLRGLRSELKALRADMHQEFRDLKHRVTQVEVGQGTIIQHIGHMAGSIAGQQVSHDSLVERIERIERRLDLADTQ